MVTGLAKTREIHWAFFDKSSVLQGAENPSEYRHKIPSKVTSAANTVFNCFFPTTRRLELKNDDLKRRRLPIFQLVGLMSNPCCPEPLRRL
jgi:hypothetical protein